VKILYFFYNRRIKIKIKDKKIHYIILFQNCTFKFIYLFISKFKTISFAFQYFWRESLANTMVRKDNKPSNKLNCMQRSLSSNHWIDYRRKQFRDRGHPQPQLVSCTKSIGILFSQTGGPHMWPVVWPVPFFLRNCRCCCWQPNVKVKVNERKREWNCRD
jgi:hypothetical protein